MRKIICYIATSADGFIARLDGSVDWLENRPKAKGDYGMRTFLRSIDAVIWGRKTYDQVRSWGHNPAAMFPKNVRHHVFSSRPGDPAESVDWVTQPVDAFARQLRASKGKNIWMMGGGGIIASFLDAGQLDEFRIHVIPTFIGEGIPLIAPGHRELPLKLLSVRKFSDGVVALHYRVNGPDPRVRRTGAEYAGQRRTRVRTKAASRARHR